MSMQIKDIENSVNGLGYVVVRRDEKTIVFARKNRMNTPVASFRIQSDGTVAPDEEFRKNMDKMITDTERRFPSIASLAPRP